LPARRARTDQEEGRRRRKVCEVCLFQGGIGYPHTGCVLSKLKGPKGDVPPQVLLPHPIGQNAGFPGKAFDPFVLNADPFLDQRSSDSCSVVGRHGDCTLNS